MPLMCSWDYSKLTVEVKLEPGAAEPPTVKVKRVVHTKEVIAEQLKREMGLHDSRGKRSRSHFFLYAKWPAQCDQLTAEDSRCLLQFDKLQAGVKLLFRNEGHLLIHSRLSVQFTRKLECEAQ